MPYVNFRRQPLCLLNCSSQSSLYCNVIGILIKDLKRPSRGMSRLSGGVVLDPTGRDVYRGGISDQI